MRRILLLVWLSMVTFMGAQAQEIVASGTCGGEGDGDNLKWILTNDYVLTINGHGIMKDYFVDIRNIEEPCNILPPWDKYRNLITSIQIESGVTSIGNYAFYDYNMFKTVVLPHGLKTIGNYAFFDCTNLENIYFPNELTNIGRNAFKMCESITSVTLPQGIETIEQGVFSDCYKLRCVVLSSGLINILDEAFRYCSRLEQIDCLASTPPNCSITAFEDANTITCKLRIPKESQQLYSVTEPWCRFKIEVIEDATGVNDVKINATNEDAEIYSLDGRRQSKANRGVNIVSGRKVIVK